jgi:hypothetical protein
MAYTDIDKPDDYFNTVLWTGNSTARDITTGHATDFAWLKVRDTTGDHFLFDIIRGTNNYVRSNLTSAEGTLANTLTAFNSDGFSLGTANAVNASGETQVGWSWKANGAGVSNTAGSISSTVSANTTSGFSIVSYTGNGTSSATVGHGLGVAPKMTIIKQRNSSNGWNVWTFANNAGDPDSFGELNSTAAWYQDQGGDGPYTTQPTSSLLTLTAYGQVNGNTNTYIAYCFAEVKGFSKFGSYIGNGSADGTFVYTGFKPAFVMLKRTNDTAHWQMQDSKRIGFNPENERLYASDPAAEQTINFIDLLSNGFKCITTDAGANGSGDNFIYMAFAENPFVTSTSIPTTAR